MYASALSVAVSGMEAFPVHVESDVRDGLPYFVMVGFPSAQVKEAQERVRTAFNNNGITLPSSRITVNFAPADIRKTGARYDLPLAASILAASGYLPKGCLDNVMILGELGLAGEVFSTAGILAGVMTAKELGCKMCVIPVRNLYEARLVPGICCLGVANLAEMIECLRDPSAFKEKTGHSSQDVESDPELPAVMEGQLPDFDEIRGQESGKRAAEIAASGFHNLLMIGPPGSGKSMVAHRIPTILPALTKDEQLEITKIYSIAGLLSSGQPLISSRPFRSPHHTCSPQSLAGGGKNPVPGEITLAHRGVLFLDEMPEFGRKTLEILRQPMEDKRIVISRINGNYAFPADFMLVAAMNPCPCGYYPDMNRCHCRIQDVAAYMGRVSRPLLDRIDLTVRFEAIRLTDFERENTMGEPSYVIRNRVEKVRQIQEERFRAEGILFNSQMRGEMIQKYCELTHEAGRLLRAAYETYSFSARTYHRILKVARTVADMDGCEVIDTSHIGEAIAFKAFDPAVWDR